MEEQIDYLRKIFQRRLTFFFNQLSQAHKVRYPKTGDFLVDRNHLFEVGWERQDL